MDKPLVETLSEPPGAAPRAAAKAAPIAPVHGTKANVRYAGAVMLIAFALMALFNSDGLRSYARDLPGGWLADALIVRADQWHELMVGLGTAEASAAMRQLTEEVRTAPW